MRIGNESDDRPSPAVMIHLNQIIGTADATLFPQ